MTRPTLKPGDRVWWRGAWGTQPPRVATVTRLDLKRTRSSSAEDAYPVPEADWDDLRSGAALCGQYVVDLDNGHFAYGYQLEPYEGGPTDEV